MPTTEHFSINITPSADITGWDDRKLSDAGVVFAIEPMTPDLVRELAPLQVNLHERHDVHEDVAHAAATLNLLRRAAKDSVYAVVARIDGQVVGFVELIVHQGDAWARHAGFDYDAQGRLPLYFGVLFYALMDFAAERGIRMVDYTIGTEEAKTSRGCIARPTVRLTKLL